MTPSRRLSPELCERFLGAVTALDHRFADDTSAMVDENQDAVVRTWLDAADSLPWATNGVTPDEWFFITTLYGTSTPAGQRTLIREYLPRFVQLTGGNMRAMAPELLTDWRLRYPWMKDRLCRMARILGDRNNSMSDYTNFLRELESEATPERPMPALDAILSDHQAGEGKTLSVFVRDCVGGNSFSIDSRVRAVLDHHGLPQNERLLVSLCLAIGRNPRQVARMFYAAGAS